MAKLDIYDRTGKAGRHVRDRADRAGAAHQQAVAARRGRHVPGQPAAGHRRHQEPRRSGRHDQEDVSPEGDGQRPGRLAAQRHPPRRRAHFRQAAARFGYRLPRKAVQVATRMALAAKIRDDQVTLIDELKLRRAQDQATWRDSQGAEAATATNLLVATAAHDVNVYKRARNIDRRHRGAGLRA